MTENNPDDTNLTVTDVAISVQNLSFHYESEEENAGSSPYAGADAIEGLSFEILAGELLLIAGPSGCGKSTLLKCLNGLIPHSYKGSLRGKIRLLGRETGGLSLRELARYAGTMLQDPDKQILGNTVEQEVAFGMENLGVPHHRMRERLQEVLTEMHLEQYRGKAIHTLSGGQRQQVAACGLLVMEPSIFLFDEPFANLDSRAVEELESLITRLRSQGKTIVIVEHRVEEALRLNPQKVLLMQEGRQIFFGETEDFLKIADPTQIKLPIASTLQTLEHPSLARDLLVRPIQTGGQSPSSDETPVLSFEHVQFRYKSATAPTLYDISFEVKRSETIALLGPNGAGKTTLVKQALGLLRPTSGSVRLYDQDTRSLSVAQLAARIGYVFQSPSAMLFAPTVNKELSFGPENLGFTRERTRSSVQQAEEALHLTEFDQRSPFSLSFGQQKRVTISSVLAMQSKILLLDEPTAGQDYKSYISFIEYLRTLPGIDALLIITHDLDLALRFTRRVLLLRDGRLVADGPPLEVLSDPALLEACNLRPTSLLQYLLGLEHSVA